MDNVITGITMLDLGFNKLAGFPSAVFKEILETMANADDGELRLNGSKLT